eukprot:scaffold24311_cov196-Cylindrotheca_fusiformis.AAC.2
MNDAPQSGVFLTADGGLTPTSFLLLIGMPLLLSGRFVWGISVLCLAVIFSLQTAMSNIKEEDKQSIRYNILEPEDIIAELEALEEESPSQPEQNDSVLGRTKCLAGLSAMAKKYKKKDRSKEFPLLCQQAAYITLRLFPEDDEAVGSSIALLALVAKHEEVRQRTKYQADNYGLDRPIEALRGVLARAKKEKDEEKEGEMAEILRKGCLMLGALSDDDKDLNTSITIVEEGGLEVILDIANWFRYHEEVANWSMWAIFILCYDRIQNKVQFVRLAGVTTVCSLLQNNPTSLEVTRHGIAILFDLLREGNSEEGKRYAYDPWAVRTQALAAGLHSSIVKAMSEFSDSMDIMMMGQEMLIGTGYRGDIPQFQQI